MPRSVRIETTLPKPFADKLRELFLSYGVTDANGWDDGCLYVAIGDEEYQVRFVREWGGDDAV